MDCKTLRHSLASPLPKLVSPCEPHTGSWRCTAGHKHQLLHKYQREQKGCTSKPPTMPKKQKHKRAQSSSDAKKRAQSSDATPGTSISRPALLAAAVCAVAAVVLRSARLARPEVMRSGSRGRCACGTRGARCRAPRRRFAASGLATASSLTTGCRPQKSTRCGTSRGAAQPRRTRPRLQAVRLSSISTLAS